MSMLEAAAMQVTIHLAEEKSRRLASENERLRGLLAIAREGLQRIALDERYAHITATNALRQSDPDVQPESGE